jgi:hypothetical protein
MKKALLTIPAAVLLLGGTAPVQAGPATSDAGGAAAVEAGQLPTLGGPNFGAAGAGSVGPGPSFGGQNPQDSGLGAPQSLPDADDLPTDSGDKK